MPPAWTQEIHLSLFLLKFLIRMMLQREHQKIYHQLFVHEISFEMIQRFLRGACVCGGGRKRAKNKKTKERSKQCQQRQRRICHTTSIQQKIQKSIPVQSNACTSFTRDVTNGSWPVTHERSEQSYPVYPLSHTHPMIFSASHKVYDTDCISVISS